MWMLGVMVLCTMCFLGELDEGAELGDDNKCGTYCLYIALRALSLPVDSFDTVDTALGRPAEGGYSFTRLSEVANRFHASTLAVETTLENLQRRSQPFLCVTSIENNHFILVTDIASDSVTIIDYPVIRTLNKREFLPFWSRKCLLLGESDLEAEEMLEGNVGRQTVKAAIYAVLLCCAMGVLASLVLLLRRRSSILFLLTLSFCVSAQTGCRPGPAGNSKLVQNQSDGPSSGLGGLVAYPNLIDLGVILSEEGNRSISSSIKLSNTGTMPLRIKEMHKICSCTDVAISSNIVNANSYVNLRAVITPGSTPGERATMVSVICDVQEQNPVDVRFKWRVVDRIRTDPIRVEEPSVLLGSIVSKSLDVVLYNRSLCDNCRFTAQSSTPSLTAEVVMDPSVVRTEKHSEGGAGSESRVGRLIVRAIAKDEGLFSGDIRLSLVCGQSSDQRYRTTVPVSWHARSQFSVSPTSLFLGTQRPNQAVEVSLILRNSQGLMPEIDSVVALDKRFSVGFTQTARTGGSDSVWLRIGTPSIQGICRTSVVFTLKGENVKVTMPISVILVDDGN